MSSPRTGFVALVAALGAGLIWVPSARAVDPVCRTSGPGSGAFTVTVCLITPLEGDLLTSDTPVDATIQVSGSQDVLNVTYSLDGSYLLMDVSVPPNGSGIPESSFTLPVSKFTNGSHVLSVRAKVKGSSTSYEALPASANVTFQAGGPTWNPPSFAAPGGPSSFTVMAVGDGADGDKQARSIAAMVKNLSPDLFLYLGDAYDQGSIPEFTNWYAQSYGIPGLRSITAPTIGNHEYETSGDARGYFDYWGYPSHYYSFDAGGWHFVSLDSTTQFGQYTPGTAQYDWLMSDLDTRSAACTLVYFHHPTYSLGQFSGAPWMSQVWSLMASEGVDLVLNGHAHNYQRWSRLDGAGAAAAPGAYGVTEIAAGTGGHALYSLGSSVDARVAYSTKSFGALKLQLGDGSADFQFLGTGASVLDHGTVNCSPARDETPPLPPSVSATAAATRVDLSWSGASDNVGVTRYEVSRDGTVFASLQHQRAQGYPQTFSDYTAAPSTTYSYTVEAFDAEDNGSGASAPAVATTPSSPDSTPPSPPGSFAATPISPYEIDLSWTGSTDDSGVPPSYDIVRDGVFAATTTSLSYRDTGLAPGSSHIYAIRARDGSNNSSDPARTAGASTPPLLFTDGFESGWTPWTKHSGLSLWQDQVYSGGWSAHGPSTTTGVRYATKTLSSTPSSVYAQERIDLLSRGSNAVDLLRFKQAGGGAILRVFVNASGFLAIKNETNGSTTTSARTFTAQAWHTLQAHVIVNGASGKVEVWLDGHRISSLSKTISLGTVPIGIFQVGDANSGRTYDVAYDDVAVDTSPIP